jgi:aquaporin Z
MNRYLVEFLGSALLVYIILATGNPLAIGAVLALILLATSHISSGFVNPIVTIVMASIGKIDIADLIPYILSQVLGGLVGLELYKRFRL